MEKEEIENLLEIISDAFDNQVYAYGWDDGDSGAGADLLGKSAMLAEIEDKLKNGE